MARFNHEATQEPTKFQQHGRSETELLSIQQIPPNVFSGGGRFVALLLRNEWTELHQSSKFNIEHRMTIGAPNNLVDIGYIAVFQNRNAPNATGVENKKKSRRPRFKFLNFWPPPPPVKLWKRWAKCLSEFFVPDLGNL